MKYLLDTCSFIWMVNEQVDRLSSLAQEVFLNEENDILFSHVSCWEIAIKWSLGKLKLEGTPKQFLEYQIQENSLKILPIHFEHITQVAHLPFHHKDPFDRLLISQAIHEQLPIISPDAKFSEYEIERVWN